MASLLRANLSSDDEDDEDYAPADAGPANKRSRQDNGGAEGARSKGANDGLDHVDVDDPAQLAKKAKVDALWQKLNSGASSAAKSSSVPSKNSFTLAQLCKPADKAKKKPDMMWMRSLGILPKDSAQQLSDGHHDGSEKASSSETAANVGEEAKSMAAAALAAAKQATTAGGSNLASGSKVTISETRKFAGQDIKVEKQVDKDSKEAQKAMERQRPVTSGLDAMLAEIEKKKKVNVLDKSKMDWQEYKKTDANVEEELEAYKKSDKKYLDKVEFLQRAELREYEKERDMRLASDVRNRGRL